MMFDRVFRPGQRMEETPGQEVVANHPCPISGDRSAIVVSNWDRHGNPLRTVISKASGLVYVDPRPDDTSIERFYRHSYRKLYKASATPRWKHTARAAFIAGQRIEKLISNSPKGGSVLDVGTGSGEMLYVGQKHGFQMVGIEPDPTYAQFGRSNYGVEIWNQSLQDAELPPDSFDAITIFHVLEHLADPLGAMRKMTDSLKPGGFLYLEVPNVESNDVRCAQKWHIGHLFHFNCATMTAMANLCGLSPAIMATCSGKNHVEAMLWKPYEQLPIDWQPLVAGNFEHTWETLQQQAKRGWMNNWSGRLSRMRHKFARNVQEWASALSEPNRRRLVDKVHKKRA